MKVSKLIALSGLAVMASVCSSSVLANTEATCPTNFDIDKSLCSCVSAKKVHCKQGDAVSYTHTHGVDVKGNTLYTRNGTVITCQGKSWGVKILDNHQIGFRCMKK